MVSNTFDDLDDAYSYTRALLGMDDEPNELEHYGVPHTRGNPGSGRYPWGSGKEPHQQATDFKNYIARLKAEGMDEKTIASVAGVSIRELRDLNTIYNNDLKRYQAQQAVKYREKGWSHKAIGEKLGIGESLVRSRIADHDKLLEDRLGNTTEALKSELKRFNYLDVGTGTELHMGVSQTQLAAALTKLETEGYRVDKIKVQQLGTKNETTVKVLSPPGTEYKDLYANRGEIGSPAVLSRDGGFTFDYPAEPKAMDPKRLGVKWGDEGGADADGVMYIRRGNQDISLGESKYAQVRIRVGDGSEKDVYLKGVAIYKDDMPKGVDVLFNTNKTAAECGGDKLKALKPVKLGPDGKIDKALPFGSVTKPPAKYVDKTGKTGQSLVNIVNEEGDWAKWSKNLSSQFLAKQPRALAADQLGLALKLKQDTLNDILALENPTVRKHLLASFADGADASAVELKAKALPRTENKVLLPIPSMPENEVYAPTFRNGEQVALIRHPHGGRFELPLLTVNNRRKDPKELIGPGARDAIGISPKVAARLSGADFDGDTVLVIPNNSGRIKNQDPLPGLRNFDTGIYKTNKTTMTDEAKGGHMGKISNLITDMTVKGATEDELARAVRHSMVVIDAPKHKLDWRQSEKDNRIKELKKKYMYDPDTGSQGASTIFSRAKSDQYVDERRAARANEGGPIDPKTGKLNWVDTGGGYYNASGEWVKRRTKSTKMYEANDAHDLSSGRAVEKVYADYANGMKTLANTARKEMVRTPNLTRSPAAAKAYAPQVESLQGKLKVALSNAPKERQAQLVAGAELMAIKATDPTLDKKREKKLKGQLLDQARKMVKAKKHRIDIEPKEWEAIQAGAISNSSLEKILANTDIKKVQDLATPRAAKTLSASKVSRAKSMARMGYTQAEIADALGISTTSVAEAIG